MIHRDLHWRSPIGAYRNKGHHHTNLRLATNLPKTIWYYGHKFWNIREFYVEFGRIMKDPKQTGLRVDFKQIFRENTPTLL